MRLLIVVVNYNGLKLTVDCLRSLKPELDTIPEARIALCDNGSADGEAQRLLNAVDRLGLVNRVEVKSIFPNRGFTGGNNAVIQPALEGRDPPEYVYLLNNDTLVLPGAIRTLLEYMDLHPDVGVGGSRLEYPDGTTQLAARTIQTALGEFESYLRFGPVTRILSPWAVVPPERNQPHEAGWVPGAAMMIRRPVFEQIGLLDEDLYTYFDDVDFCLRARRAGWPTWYVPQSRIVHFVGKTTGVTDVDFKPKRRASYWFQARRHYFLKNFGAAYAAVADVAAIAGLALWGLRCRMQHKPNPDPPHLLRDFVRHSVFVTGFRKHPVPNPAFQRPAPPAKLTT